MCDDLKRRVRPSIPPSAGLRAGGRGAEETGKTGERTVSLKRNAECRTQNTEEIPNLKLLACHGEAHLSEDGSFRAKTRNPVALVIASSKIVNFLILPPPIEGGGLRWG